jgi:hypothetical protein
MKHPPIRHLIAGAAALAVGATSLLAGPAAQADTMPVPLPNLVLNGEHFAITPTCAGDTTYPEIAATLTTAVGVAEADITYSVRQTLYYVQEDPPMSAAWIEDVPEGVVVGGPFKQISTDDATTDFLAYFTAYKAGEYRIVVTVAGEVVTAEFSVDEAEILCPDNLDITLVSQPVGLQVGQTGTLEFYVKDGLGRPVADLVNAVTWSAATGLDVVAVYQADDYVVAFDVTASAAGSYDFKLKPADQYTGSDAYATVDFGSVTPPLNWFQQLIEKLIAFLTTLLGFLKLG